MCACGAHGHPAHLCLFCLLVCFVCYTGVVGWVCCNKGRWGLCGGLCGVVDVGDELLCFVDQGVAEESGTGQQHQHNTSRQYVIEAEPRDR